MSNSIKVLFLVLSLTFAACTLPSFSSSTGFGPTRSSPPRSTYAPPPVMQPSGAQSTSPGETDDQIRARQSREEHARLDAMEKERAQESDPNYGVILDIQVAQDDLNWIKATGGASRTRLTAQFTREAHACSAYVAAQTAPGTRTVNIHIGIGNTAKTPILITDVEAKICQPLLAVAKDWDAKLDAAQAAEEAPYRKVGIKGTKLSFTLTHSDGLVTVGQRVIVEPAQMARTNVFFVLLTKNDGTFLLERYEFSGNKLVAKTEQGFLLQPGPSHYR